nr:copia protein [Tanacetum cinerariifolium]
MALHPKWRAKVMAIEESKDLSSLALNELIRNLKVHEVVMEKDSKIYKGKKERIKSITLKTKKESSDDETLTSGSDDEEYAMGVRNFKKFFRRKGKFVRQQREERKSLRQREEKKEKSGRKCFRCGDPSHLIVDYPKTSRNKDQKSFIGGFWSDSKNDAEDKTKDETCLMTQLSNEFGLEDSKPTMTPMSMKIKLTKDDEADSVDSSKYQGIIGSLLYLTASRPDIMFSVCLCARFQENPKNTHLEAVKNIFRYIRGTNHLGLWYPKGTGIKTVVYADSDHAGDYVDRKSTSGVCTFMGCCLTSWFTKKQTALTIFTTEAEYVSAEKACQQALWMKQALIDYGIRLDNVPIMCDNKGAIDLSICIYFDAWGLNELEKTLKQIEPCNSRLPAIDDIRNLIDRRTVHEKIDKEGNTIYKLPNQIETSDLFDHLRPCELVIRENVYSAIGNRDHTQVVNALMLYYLENRQPFNLAYFIIRMRYFFRDRRDKVLPYDTILTRLFDNLKANTTQGSFDERYKLVPRKISSLKAKQPKKPPPKRTRNVGKSKQTQLTTSSSTESPPSDNGDLPSTKLSPRSYHRALKDDLNMSKEKRETKGMFKNLAITSSSKTNSSNFKRKTARMSVKYPNYVNLTSSSEEQPNERTPSPPPRKKSLSQPQAPSKSITSKITHYISSSSPSESLKPTHVAPPPKLHFVIPIKLKPQELPPLQVSPNDPYVQTMDNWPTGPSNPSPPPRVSRPPIGFPNPPPRFEPLPSTQHLFVNINNNTPLLHNNATPLENINHPPPNHENQDFPNPPNILDFIHPNDMPHLHNIFSLPTDPPKALDGSRRWGIRGVLGGCWEVVGKVTGSRGKWWSGAEMGESGVAGCGGNLG